MDYSEHCGSGHATDRYHYPVVGIGVWWMGREINMGIDLQDAFERATSSGKYGKYKQVNDILERANPWGKSTAQFQSGMLLNAMPGFGQGGSSSEVEMGNALDTGNLEQFNNMFNTSNVNPIGKGEYQNSIAGGFDQEHAMAQGNRASMPFMSGGTNWKSIVEAMKRRRAQLNAQQNQQNQQQQAQQGGTQDVQYS
jgi:hypothetical protein